jgi:hypothetical protein
MKGLFGMEQINHSHELIADIRRRIAEEELKLRERIDRISHYAGPDEKDEIREAWGRFNMSVEPMRRQIEYVIKQLAISEGMKIHAPVTDGLATIANSGK